MAGFLIFLLTVAGATARFDITQKQLLEYKNTTEGNVSILITSAGIPVASEFVTTINTDFLNNDYFLDSMTHFMRERIPERIVHSKGAGAFGTFTVTDDLKDISKLPHIGPVGTVVPVAVRFSGAFSQSGGSDVARENRGFGIKFYAGDANFDYLFLTTEMFPIKDPIYFPAFSKVYGDSDVTGVTDVNARWDFLTLRPESLNSQTRIFGDIGIPDGHRSMPGSCIHTFNLINDEGKVTYARLHMFPDSEVKTLTASQAKKIQKTDLHYARRDLYNAIEEGNFPTWTSYIQTIAEANITQAGFDIFDVTKLWPGSKYPMRPFGKMELNKNPRNYFADIEQLAFNPASLFPGVRGVDDLFKSRILFYRDAQNYRLGVNHKKIAVNCPFSKKFNNYNKDGRAPVLDNGGKSPFYYPNSFNGPIPYNNTDPKLPTVVTEAGATNFDQLSDYYEELTECQKCRLIDNIVSDLGQAYDFLQERAVKIYKQANVELGRKIEEGLLYKNAACPFN